MQLKFFNLPVDVRQRIYNINNKEKEESLKLRNVYFKKLLIYELDNIFLEIKHGFDPENFNEFPTKRGIINYMNSAYSYEFRRRRFQYSIELLEFDREWYKKFEKMLETINGGSNLINWNCMKEVNNIKQKLKDEDQYASSDTNSDSYSDSDSDSDSDNDSIKIISTTIIDLDDY